MNFEENGLHKATCYLAENRALRHAVGADDGELLEPSYLGEGEHNLNYGFTAGPLARTYVLRINVARQPFHKDQVGYEFEALQALAPSGVTPGPIWLDNSPQAPGQGALVIEFCEGDQLDYDHLRPGDLRCAAQILADAHAVELPDDCAIYRPADPLQELFDECVQRFELYRASAFEDARITRWIERFIAASERMLRTRCLASDCRHIVNTEPLPSHFLIPDASARMAAASCGTGRFCEAPGSFLDWERPIIGEVAQDVAYFVSPTTTFWDSEFLFPSSAISGFVADYWQAVDARFDPGNFEERFRAFLMMTALRSTTWCARALLSYAPGAQGRTTEKTARKLPRYLSEDFMQLLAEECFGL